MVYKRKTERFSTVVGLANLDARLLDKLCDKINTDQKITTFEDKINRRKWVSLVIGRAFKEQFGEAEFQIQRKAWLEEFLENEESANDKI